jgi:hypothetical protein
MWAANEWAQAGLAQRSGSCASPSDSGRRSPCRRNLRRVPTPCWRIACRARPSPRCVREGHGRDAHPDLRSGSHARPTWRASHIEICPGACLASVFSGIAHPVAPFGSARTNLADAAQARYGSSHLSPTPARVPSLRLLRLAAIVGRYSLRAGTSPQIWICSSLLCALGARGRKGWASRHREPPRVMFRGDGLEFILGGIPCSEYCSRL